MNVRHFVPTPLKSLLDVGCNAGAWLKQCANEWPEANLAGIDINQVSLEKAKDCVPHAKIYNSGAEIIPFDDHSFQCVTCMEVLEHVPKELRQKSIQEIRRVLHEHGKLILTVPHAGWFAWLDSNNMRHRFPSVYKWIVGKGKRDSNYERMGRIVEWHHHYTLQEIITTCGNGWRIVTVKRGGLFIYPLMDWLSWPFYKIGLSDHPIRKLFESIAGWDYSINYGSVSYGILVVLEKTPIGSKIDYTGG